MTEGGPDGALGYVAQVSDANAYVGGLFVVSPEGDPLDFAYTDDVARAVSVHSSAIEESLRKLYGAGDLADELGR